MRLGLVVLVACGGAVAPVPEPKPRPPEPPVVAPLVAVDPPQPTLRLPRHFVPQSYAAHLQVDPTKPTFSGEIVIGGQLAEPTHVIWLHGRNLTVAKATANNGERGVDLAVTKRGDDLLELRATDPLAAGLWALTLSYTGKVSTDAQAGVFASPLGQDNYVYTQMEPIHARSVFPCLDEPDRKVPWQLTLDVPPGVSAVSNTMPMRTTPSAAGTSYEFAPTRPLPSYLISFAVGPFAIIDAGHSKSGVPVRVVTPRGTEDRARYAATVTPKLIDVIENWFGSPFPYPKLDIVISPSYDDAMEDAGAILTGPDMLLDVANPSWAGKRVVATYLGHELAHQWFGDLVTPAWWDDLWLKESFATWMENSITSWVEPTWNDEDVRIGTKHNALSADALTAARKIHNPIAKPGDIFNAFDGITYNKGASILRMIERYVGVDVFRSGVQAYMKAHADGVATSSQLISAIETASGKPVTPVFASFFEQTGAPVLSMSLSCGPSPRIKVAQQRYLPLGAPAQAPQTWTIPVCIAHEANGSRVRTCGVIDQPTGSIPLASCPAWWIGNADGDGYYRIAVTANDVAMLVKPAAWKALTNRERRTLLEDARSQVMIGKLPVASVMSIAKPLREIDDWQSIGDALGGTGRFGPYAMTGLPNELDGVIPPVLRERVRTRLLAEIGPRAAALGFVGAPGDSYNRERSRSVLVAAAANLREPRLSRKAVELAKDYRSLPASIRWLVLQLAVPADPTLADKLVASVLAEPDRERRLEILRALVAIPDATRRNRALDLALDPKFDVADLRALLFGYHDETERAGVETWLRAHWPELQKRLPPPTEISIAAYLGWVFVAACDPGRRDEILSYTEKQFGNYIGNRRAEQVESLDQCIARRAAIGPSIQAWLGNGTAP